MMLAAALEGPGPAAGPKQQVPEAGPLSQEVRPEGEIMRGKE